MNNGRLGFLQKEKNVRGRSRSPLKKTASAEVSNSQADDAASTSTPCSTPANSYASSSPGSTFVNDASAFNLGLSPAGGGASSSTGNSKMIDENDSFRLEPAAVVEDVESYEKTKDHEVLVDVTLRIRGMNGDLLLELVVSPEKTSAEVHELCAKQDVLWGKNFRLVFAAQSNNHLRTITDKSPVESKSGKLIAWPGEDSSIPERFIYVENSSKENQPIRLIEDFGLDVVELLAVMEGEDDMLAELVQNPAAPSRGTISINPWMHFFRDFLSKLVNHREMPMRNHMRDLLKEYINLAKQYGGRLSKLKFPEQTEDNITLEAAIRIKDSSPALVDFWEQYTHNDNRHLQVPPVDDERHFLHDMIVKGRTKNLEVKYETHRRVEMTTDGMRKKVHLETIVSISFYGEDTKKRYEYAITRDTWAYYTSGQFATVDAALSSVYPWESRVRGEWFEEQQRGEQGENNERVIMTSFGLAQRDFRVNWRHATTLLPYALEWWHDE